MKLFSRKLGSGPPLIVLHGFLGSSDNWLTLAKQFAEHRTVFLVDQRNHGQSPHSHSHTYPAMVDDLLEFFHTHELSSSALLGHSMGGKTAMNFAVLHPKLVERLLVVDISPLPFQVEHDDVLRGMGALETACLTSRVEADQLLMGYLPDPAVRQFVLKNLTRDESGKLSWRVNLAVLTRDSPKMGEGMQYAGRFDGPTLFVRGTRSSYIGAADEQAIHALFPQARVIPVEAGHWVQADNASALLDVALPFLNPYP